MPARDEHHAALPVAVRPAVQLDRRMREMLHELHHHRPLAAFDVEKALHAQQVRPAHRHQRVHGARETPARHRLVVVEHETGDAVRMRRLPPRRHCARSASPARSAASDRGRRSPPRQCSAPGLSARSRADERCGRAFAGDVGLGDDQPVGEDRLLARLRRPFERRRRRSRHRPPSRPPRHGTCRRARGRWRRSAGSGEGRRARRSRSRRGGSRASRRARARPPCGARSAAGRCA